MKTKKIVLLILDGWGYRESSDKNAVVLSNPENYNNLMANCPNKLINASEEWVGLPAGQMGNSEVGHTNIGAGRIVYQDLLRINRAVDSGEIRDNLNIINFFDNVKSNGGNVHFFGLLSDGGVHSHILHLKGLMDFAKTYGIKESVIHAFMDGRDTPPKSGYGYMEDIQKYIDEIDYGKIGVVSGRYYAMDRDNRWDRVEKAYKAIRFGEGIHFEEPVFAVSAAYDRGETDEFIQPSVIGNFKGISDNDGIFFFNFRSDRARELTKVFIEKGFDKFDTKVDNSSILFMTMTEYDEKFNITAAFPQESLNNILGEVISNNGLTQLRIAETEKYAHVTFFFNGGREVEFKNELRALIPSPKDVATYDLKPSMSVASVVDRFIEEHNRHDIALTIMNFANPDMVGHTGIEAAAIAACKAVDVQLGRVIDFAKNNNAVLLVTADHGNSEQMWDYENNQPHTAHTTNLVPFIVYNYECKLRNSAGKLADIAPTILDILDIPQPNEMTGESFIVR